MNVEKRTASIPNSTAVLFVIVALLASSTVFFAYQGRTGNSTSQSTTKTPTDPYLGKAISLISGPEAQAGTASSTSNSISVSGTGEVSYVPNEALVSVSVVTIGTTAGDATSSNAVAMSAVIDALNGIGISNSSIETNGYSLYANYAECDSSCVPRITGYTVTNSLQINITSAVPSQLGVQAGRVIDTAVAAGANQVSLSFGETNSELVKLESSALQQAVTSAYSTAHLMASSLGVNITGVISASEGTTYTPEYYGPNVVFATALSVSPSATPIMPGTQSMSVSAQVVYAID